MICINFAYRGRLDPEKWVDQIVESIRQCIYDYRQTHYHFHIDIWWNGSLEEIVKELASSHPDIVNYHGYVPNQELRKQIWHIHYLLMPSTFLETFGLVGLEACSMGIPVIWYARWWLKQFILPDYDCSHSDVYRVIQKCIVNFEYQQRIEASIQSKNISMQYSPSIRYNQFIDYIT